MPSVNAGLAKDAGAVGMVNWYAAILVVGNAPVVKSPRPQTIGVIDAFELPAQKSTVVDCVQFKPRLETAPVPNWALVAETE